MPYNRLTMKSNWQQTELAEFPLMILRPFSPISTGTRRQLGV